MPGGCQLGERYLCALRAASSAPCYSYGQESRQEGATPSLLLATLNTMLCHASSLQLLHRLSEAEHLLSGKAARTPIGDLHVSASMLAMDCWLGPAHRRGLSSQVEAGGLLPKGVMEAVQEAKVERRLGSAMHMGMHSNMTDSARLGEHLFGIPQARKGLIGGVCVAAVLSLGLAVVFKGYLAKKRTRRRRLQSV